MSKKELKWTTRDGETVAIKDMKDNHLLNTCRFMENKTVALGNMYRYADHPIWGPRGDGAQMAFQNELSDMEEQSWAVYHWIHALSDEIQKRGLEKLACKKPLEMPEGELVEDTGHGQIWKLKKCNDDPYQNVDMTPDAKGRNTGDVNDR